MKLPAKLALVYFAAANIVFFAGVNRIIDSFLWGVVSAAIYWPFSYVTRLFLDFVGDPAYEPPRQIAFGITAYQLSTYLTDVVLGALWWWLLAVMCHGIIRRLRAGRLHA
jgi:hypothetical protein